MISAPVTSYGTDLTTNQAPSLELENGGVDQEEEFVMGKWEVELCDWRRLLGGTRGFMACFCPSVTYAQISARLFPDDTFWWIVVSNFVNQATIPFWAVMAIKAIVDGQEFYVVAIYAYLVVMYVYLVRSSVATLRDSLRDRFKIPGTSAEDQHAALWWFPCALAQMATQVKSSKAASCSFSKPNELPSYIH